MIDQLYIENIFKIREFALVFTPKDRECAVIMTDAIRRCANLEVLYYKLANGYLKDAEIKKYLKQHVQPYDYIVHLNMFELIRHKRINNLKEYISLFQVGSGVPEVELNTDIIKYPKNLSSRTNLKEIVKLYGRLPIPQ